MAKSTTKTRRQTPAPKVLVTSTSVDRSMLRGIWRFDRSGLRWSILSSSLDEERMVDPRSITAWASAAIVGVSSPQLAESMKSLRLPVVSVFESPWAADIPTVCVNNNLCGRMAFEHLRSVGLSRFAYLPWESGVDNLMRQEGLLQAASANGFSQHTSVLHCALSHLDWGKDMKDQARIFVGLPKPIGIFCFSDWLARLAIQTALMANLRIPEDISFIGLGNTDVYCECAQPTLTCIDPDYERVGFEAMKLLDRLVHGQRSAPREPVYVPPRGVIQRMSTQYFTDDHAVAAALRFIQDEQSAGRWPATKQVADAACVSRRCLDGKFTKLLGRTVSDELSQRRIAHALHLLETTDFSPKQISAKAGFGTVSHLGFVVRKNTGRSPISYRKWIRR